jgi:glucose dehydrogenase
MESDIACTTTDGAACKMLDTVQLHTGSGSAAVNFFKTMLLCKCQMITTLQANSIVALDLDTGDISWSVQLGPLESWVYSCISSAALNLNLSGVDIHL